MVRIVRHAANPKRAEETIRLYADIVRNVQIGLVVLHLERRNDAQSFRLVDINPAAVEFLGARREDLLGKTLADFPDVLKSDLPKQFLEVVRTGKPQDLGEIPYGDELIRHGAYASKAFPLPNQCLGIAFENNTERKRAEGALREAEEHFRLLVQGVKDYAIFMLDTEGRVLSWNPGAERIKGYRDEEIIGKHFSIFYLPEEVEQGKPEVGLREAARAGGWHEEEGWRVRKDGSRFWANVVTTALRDELGNLREFAKVTRDISERQRSLEALRKGKEELESRVKERTAELGKANEGLQAEIAEHRRTEKQLRVSFQQLRALAARLQTVREQERTKIAREVHDELGQALTAIKMDFAYLIARLPDNGEQFQERKNSILKLTDDTIQQVRRIAAELRPGILDDLGLTAAIEWQAQEFQARAGIQCLVHLPEDEISSDRDRSTAIFRIFQEALTNVARHAQATRVDVRLEKGPTELILEVRDDGKGIEGRKIQDSKSLGLLGMKERALILGGTLEVRGRKGEGTTLSVRIPVERRKTARPDQGNV